MDRTLKEGTLAQATSRISRTLSRDSKPHGKIRFYRQDDAMRKYVENALRIYTRGGNDTLQETEEGAGNQELKDLENGDILAKPQSHQIQELEGTVARLKELAGDDFSQVPRGANGIREFVNLAFSAQSKIRQLVQQGYELGTEIDVLDDNNESAGEMIRLDIVNADELDALQAKLYDTKEELPESKRPDLTEIKMGIGSFDHEIIDYDMLVELSNNLMDEKTGYNREAIDEHITPMDDKSRQEINEIVDDIESGEIMEHFTTEALQQERKKRRTGLQELKIRRWAADQDVNGNRAVEASDLFLPGHTFIDSPNLADLVREVEKEENIDFFGVAEFEEALMEFFDSL